MATRIELRKELMAEAIQKLIDSAKRGANSTKEPRFKLLYEEQLRELAVGAATITEIK